MSMSAKIVTSEPSFQTTFILRRFRLSTIVDIIKNATMFIKAAFQGSKKIKRTGCIKLQSISVFYYIIKEADFRCKNFDVIRTRGCVAWFIYFLNLVLVTYNCGKFHYCKLRVADFWEGVFLPPSHPLVSGHLE